MKKFIIQNIKHPSLYRLTADGVTYWDACRGNIYDSEEQAKLQLPVDGKIVVITFESL